MAPTRVTDEASQAGSQLGAGGGSSSRSVSDDMSTGCTTPAIDQNECLQTNLTGDIKIITAYLAVEHLPACMGHALRRIKSAVKILLAGMLAMEQDRYSGSRCIELYSEILNESGRA